MSLIKCKACGEMISENANSCPHCGEPIAKKKKTPIFVWILLILFILYFVGEVNSKIGGVSSSSSKVTVKDVRLEYKIKRGISGSTIKGDFTVHNNGHYTIKDIKIKCTHFAESGTKIDSNTKTIYSSIGGLNSKTFNDFSMGFIHSQVYDTVCEVVGLEVN